MGDKKDLEKKLAGQRKAIKEHIEKYNFYQIDHEKQFALKTIQNAQQQIEDLRRRWNGLSSCPLDTWSPPGKNDY